MLRVGVGCYDGMGWLGLMVCTQANKNVATTQDFTKQKKEIGTGTTGSRSLQTEAEYNFLCSKFNIIRPMS